MNSPSRSLGRQGLKRRPQLQPTDEQDKSRNSKSSSKPRKKTSCRKRLTRRKDHIRSQATKSGGTHAEGVDFQSLFGFKTSDLAECVLSDEEDREEFLQSVPSPLCLQQHLNDSIIEVQGEAAHSNVQELETPIGRIESSTEVPSSSSYAFNEPSTSFAISVGDDVAITLGRTEDLSSDVENSPRAAQADPSVNISPSSPVCDTISPPTSLILQVVDKLKKALPPNWQPIGDKQCLYLYRLSVKEPHALQREIKICFSGKAEIFVHCKPFPLAAQVLQSLEFCNVSLIDESCVDQFCAWGASIAKKLECYAVCVGADNLELREVWENIQNAHVDENPYQEERYSETCRSNSCSLLIVLDGRVKRCQNCMKVLRSLRTRRLSLLNETPNPKTPNIHLTREQTLEKLRIMHDEMRRKDKRIAYLEGRFRDIIEKEGVDLEEDLSSDLANILAKANMTPAQEIFFREQFTRAGKADPRAHRWHPYMIRLALHVYMKSPSAYNALKGVIGLPCQRTLYDYSHAFVSQEGLNEDILLLAKKTVGRYSNRHQKYVTLFGDEMTVSKNLVYRQSDGRLIGYCYLDKIDEEILGLEKELQGDTTPLKRTLASKMMAFMIKGCTSNLKYLIAAYPCTQLTRDMLYTWTWQLISRLERAGIGVLAFVADGNAVNRSFIDMHPPITKTKSGIVFDTVNFCSAERRALYFICDVAHLLKTVRNGFYNSGEGPKKTRCLEINREKIVWKTVVRLFFAYRRDNFVGAYKLNAQNVFPNSYSQMKVKYAAQVLSDTVALQIEKENWVSTKETVRFIRTFNKFFDVLNGNNLYKGSNSLNTNLNPYESENDSRFKWLEEDFLQYLHEWQLQVSQIKKLDSKGEIVNLSAPEQEKKLLPRQTRQGLEIAIRGFIAATKFLLKEGASFVLARTFSQDCLEQHFSLQRAGGGGSTNPNTQQFLSKQVSISIQRDLGIAMRGNVTEGGERADLSDEPVPKRPRRNVPK